MRWFTTNKKDFVGLECVNGKTNKHLLRLTPNSNFTPVGENEGNIRYIAVTVSKYPTTDDIKKHLFSLQLEYDNSDDVNSFYLNGKRVWLDKATRVGLINLLTLEKSLNKTDTTLWLNKDAINISIDKAVQLLTSLEMYAKECYNNTHQHLLDISNLESIEECLAFDITSGYPEKLNIKIK